MRLQEFIKELQTIANSVDDSDKMEVTMADCIPVVKPICKKNTIFITDVKQDAGE